MASRKSPTLKFKILHEAAVIPRYKTSGAAGMDVSALVEKPVTINPQRRTIIKTGLAVEIPAGFEMQVRPRSGLAAKNGVTVLNAPGTIDSDYRGEIAVILYNAGLEPFVVNNGDRIAQLVLAPVAQMDIDVTEGLSETDRGEGGFGSTGVSA
ncbi:MAG: dUTP diphosphatase [Roseibium sp.]|nr:dUTP diphosphatase [Roseibium sp.]